MLLCRYVASVNQALLDLYPGCQRAWNATSEGKCKFNIYSLLSSVGCPASGHLLSLVGATFLFQRTSTVRWGMRELLMNCSLPWSKQMSGVSLSFTCSLSRSLTHWLTHSLTHFNDWSPQSFAHSFIHSLIRPSSMHPPPTHLSFYLLFLSPRVVVSALRSIRGNTERPY